MNSRGVAIVSIMGEKDVYNHLIDDDEFWVDYFHRHSGKSVSVFSTNLSVKNITDSWPGLSAACVDVSENLRWLPYRLKLFTRLLSVVRLRKTTIIFQGFEELSLLLFLFLFRNKSNTYVLVPTNNISSARMRQASPLLIFALSRIIRLVDVVLYHVDFELELLKSVLPEVDVGKFRKITYHKLMPKRVEATGNPRSGKTVCFFGPIKKGKDIELFLNLVRNDKEEHFQYQVFVRNASAGSVTDSDMEFIASKDNVQLITGWIPDDAYYAYIASASYIFLGHNEEFAGKLSGNICDAISLGTPIISLAIPPIGEYSEKYGDFGYWIDRSNKDWVAGFIKQDRAGIRNEYLESLGRLRSSFTKDQLFRELDVALTGVGQE